MNFKSWFLIVLSLLLLALDLAGQGAQRMRIPGGSFSLKAGSNKIKARCVDSARRTPKPEDVFRFGAESLRLIVTEGNNIVNNLSFNDAVAAGILEVKGLNSYREVEFVLKQSEPGNTYELKVPEWGGVIGDADEIAEISGRIKDNKHLTSQIDELSNKVQATFLSNPYITGFFEDKFSEFDWHWNQQSFSELSMQKKIDNATEVFTSTSMRIAENPDLAKQIDDLNTNFKSSFVSNCETTRYLNRQISSLNRYWTEPGFNRSLMQEKFDAVSTVFEHLHDISKLLPYESSIFSVYRRAYTSGRLPIEELRASFPQLIRKEGLIDVDLWNLEFGRKFSTAEQRQLSEIFGLPFSNPTGRLEGVTLLRWGYNDVYFNGKYHNISELSELLTKTSTLVLDGNPPTSFFEQSANQQALYFLKYDRMVDLLTKPQKPTKFIVVGSPDPVETGRLYEQKVADFTLFSELIKEMKNQVEYRDKVVFVKDETELKAALAANVDRQTVTFYHNSDEGTLFKRPVSDFDITERITCESIKGRTSDRSTIETTTKIGTLYYLQAVKRMVDRDRYNHVDLLSFYTELGSVYNQAKAAVDNTSNLKLTLVGGISVVSVGVGIVVIPQVTDDNDANKSEDENTQQQEKSKGKQ